MQREAVPEDVSMAGSALVNVKAAGLGIELRPWQEALEEHLRRSRSESGAAAPAPQVNR